MPGLVPIFDSLDYYPDPQVQVPRYQNLYTQFERTYHVTPDFVSRSPGRVNLIGEHIDYCQFSVLPLAIDVDVIMAVRAQDERVIELANLDPTFGARTIPLPDGDLISIDASESDWSNYFKCGLLVAHELLMEKTGGKVLLKGMKILTTGSVPAGSGLSSSAAFVCASALATLHANGMKHITKADMTKITIVSEHHMGVNTGGMDQAASVCGERNHALYVEFRPELKATAFKFPELDPPLAFLIANTLVTSNKHETAPTNYNLRVVEVSVAAQLLAKKLSVTIANDGNLNCGTLRGVMDSYYASHGQAAWLGAIQEGEVRLSQMLELTEKHIRKEAYTTQELAAELGLTEAEFHDRFLSLFPVSFEKLHIYARAKHVYSEALRVLKALLLLQLSTDSGTFYTEFGRLMDQSQASCDTLFNCSCDEINRICDIARKNGATGSRLTGAGWGGCTVHLVPVNRVTEVERALIDEYYKVKFPGITVADLQEAIVVSKPAYGSSLYIQR
ncbi:hypothetical protein BABINDRAFT_170134 [Babjeviella inositovora NRRL Y-12698]|uniref:Galactokinase n=1 Tax=Babjeviella inositovora NRRL Y-12698 TaxID=984486 RepID=A0A1E3R158_9ASCO|nr:uncharacterized protein BABINDRAFT_170134 [Babjeviella inositovora NRRL Y-12698]ODQ83092.1 hypothetical protein BABINDRAFT_170134 [Babjeviella inositovora NRRL Y-12698]